MADRDDQWYTVKEAAHILNVHFNFVYALVREGKLKARRLGRIIRIPREAVRLIGLEQTTAAKHQLRHVGDRSPSRSFDTDKRP